MPNISGPDFHGIRLVVETRCRILLDALVRPPARKAYLYISLSQFASITNSAGRWICQQQSLCHQLLSRNMFIFFFLILIPVLRIFTVLDAIIQLGVHKTKPLVDIIYALHVALTHSL
jgi:hypothetical protein